MTAPSRAPEIQAVYQARYRAKHRDQILAKQRIANAKRRNGGILPNGYRGELGEFSRIGSASRFEQALLHAQNRAFERERQRLVSEERRRTHPGESAPYQAAFRARHPDRAREIARRSDAKRQAKLRTATAMRRQADMTFDLSFIPADGPGRTTADIGRLWGRKPRRGIARLIRAARLRAVYGPVAPRGAGWRYWAL